MNTANFKPMRWQCSEHGCYNDKLRLKFGVFSDCFERGISFTDVDGSVEVNGYFLFVEWKNGPPVSLQRGQRLYFNNLTLISNRVTVLQVAGNAETMNVTHIRVVKRGSFGPWEQIDLMGLRQRIKDWRVCAEDKPRFVGEAA